MQFDPEEFGRAMGEAIKNAVAPLHKKIADLEAQLAALPAPQNGKDGAAGRDGKDCDMDAVKSMVEELIGGLEIPIPQNGRDGKDGADGKSLTIVDVRPVIDEAVKAIRDESLQAIDVAIKAMPAPKDGRDGRDGKDGVDGKDGRDGERGEKGADGIGLAGAMLDRDGELLVTMTNGEVKKLGAVVGRDGRDGKDGVDGIGFESFEMEYLDETHEVRIKAGAAGRVKEIRFPAGGISLGGYWRDGSKAKALQVYSLDGNAYVAKRDTSAKPSPTSEDWVLMARKGRDGETVVKTVSSDPPKPIKLGKPGPEGDK